MQPDGTTVSREKKPKNRRKSFLLRNRREIAMKKIKHSVAIDDIPSEYRTLSLRFRRSSDQKRQSNSSMPGQFIRHEQNNGEQLPPLRQSLLSRQKSLIDQTNHSSMRKFTINVSTEPSHPLTSIIGDGGVYCGD